MGSVTSTKIGKILAALACACLISLGVSGPSGMSGISEAHAAAKKKTASKKPVKKKAAKKGSSRGYEPPYAALVVDAKTGKVLHAENPNEIRHPASLTKVMTLYILFDELERGSLTLDTPLKVSAEAARQAPSKLGLRPGETIRVEDAIKALVTKSANDAAVVIAENISGSHTAFAQRMTRKARALGMANTVYRNANGLPDPGQVTTARDLVILGRAIQDNHPDYFKYFSTRSFTWRGNTFANHNRLLGSVRGVDGIKTGYVRASGFNLLTSAKEGGREIVAVVLGGRSAASRDARMRELVQGKIALASAGKRTAPKIVAAAVNEPPAVLALASERASTPAPLRPTGSVPHPAPRPADRTPAASDPLMVALAASQPAPVTTPPAIPTPPMPVPAPAQALPVPIAAAAAPSAAITPQPQPAPRPVGTAAAPATESATVQPTAVPVPPAPVRPTPEEIARRIEVAMASTTPGNGNLRWVVGAQPTQAKIAANAYAAGTTPGSGLPPPSQQQAMAEAAASRPQLQPATAPQVRRVQTLPIRPDVVAQASMIPAAQPVDPEPIEAEPVDEPQPTPAPVVKAPPPGWMIQIGATPSEEQALGLIERASKTVKAIDRDAAPYTETVEKDGVTLYRARFAGLNERSATAACKAVKRSSLSCFTLKN